MVQEARGRYVTQNMYVFSQKPAFCFGQEEVKEVKEEVVEKEPKVDETTEVEDGEIVDEEGDEEYEERIRGGGKVSDRGGGRSDRRYAPYKTTGDDVNEDMGRRVYVGNLAWDVSWQDLKDHMKDSGEEVIRADVITGPDGRSKGCGVVEFVTKEGAQKAISTLNETELHGRQIFVREDREGPRSRGHHTSRRFSSGEKSKNRRVYVGNLSWDVAWQDLKDHMREAGEVLHAEVIMEANGRSKGCGIVEYATEEEAQEAIDKLNDTELKDRMIFVREDRETRSGTYHGGGVAHHPNGASVFVSNLSYDTTWQSLKDHMRQAGNVDQAKILNGPDGEPIGSAVVVYQRQQEAARAIRELQNSELNGRPIYIRADRMQPGGGRGFGGRGRSFGGRGSYSSGRARGGVRGSNSSGIARGCQLYVGNLSFDTTWRELKDHFRQCGQVDRVEVMEYPDGRKKGFGTVRFFREDDAQDAIDRLNGVELQGRELEVRMDAKAS